jgi:hypothetical protein
MSVQTTYTKNVPVAYEGLVADNNPERTISKVVETAAIPYGRAVGRGTGDDQVVLGLGAGYVGIAKRVLNQENPLGSSVAQYNVKDAAAIFQEGSIYLNITTTGAVGVALKLIDATGLIATGAPGAGETAIPGATLEETVGSINTIALCRFKSE